MEKHRLRKWLLLRLPVAFATLAALVLFGPLSATAGHADPGMDNAVLLDPFDPVPEVQFRHFGADCFSECGYGYGYGCYHSCGYGCHYGCSHRHHCYQHCGEGWRDQRSDWQAFRYDNQSNRYDRFSRRYDRQSREWDAIVNGDGVPYADPHDLSAGVRVGPLGASVHLGWFDDHPFWHDGHGRWRDGDGRWHPEEGFVDPPPADALPPDAALDDEDGPPPPPPADNGWDYSGRTR